MVTLQQLLSTIRQGHACDIQEFDRYFEADTTSFASHLHRCYLHLAEILAASPEKIPQHVFLVAAYLWHCANSLLAAFTLLRKGYPVQSLDLGRRVVESVAVAVYISDNQSVAGTPQLFDLKASKCVTYANKHMRNIGQSYGFFSIFDHAHSAMMESHPLFSKDNADKTVHFALGPSSVIDRKPLFTLACLRLLSSAHNLEGVVEMLLFWRLSGPKRYWVPVENHIEYRPVGEELQCEQETGARLSAVNTEIDRRFGEIRKRFGGR